MKPSEALRYATRESHRKLELLPSQARLLAPDYHIEEYRGLLQRLYGFYDPLNNAVRYGSGRAQISRYVARRVTLLSDDLRVLGVTLDQLTKLPRCRALPRFDTPDRELGCAYVVAGSALGGRIICKHLEAVFADVSDVPSRFFAGDGDRTTEHWRTFCDVLDAEAEDVRNVCAAARDVFEALTQWLSAAGPVAP